MHMHTRNSKGTCYHHGTAKPDPRLKDTKQAEEHSYGDYTQTTPPHTHTDNGNCALVLALVFIK